VDLSVPYRVPLSWLLRHGSESIQLRTLQELAPPGHASPPALESAVLESKPVREITSHQADNGSWGGNLLGVALSAREGIKEVGTIPQYRRLVQLGYAKTGRAFKLADRLLFRLLTRDPDPTLLFEFQKLAQESEEIAEWLRERNREAASAALAESGHIEDPRVRGSAHKIVSAVSAFLRSPLADKPFTRAGGHTILHPEAHPPTWYSVAMLAAMPSLQRERAGFTERLGQYLAEPAPKKEFALQVGKKTLKPSDILLGDPTEADAKGNVDDIPLALHFYEQLARLGVLSVSPIAAKVLERLYGDCDQSGVWHPKKLTAAPKASHPTTYHMYPLQADTKSHEGRVADVSFRLALIARLQGRPLEYT
jgi:hypothetical protein